MNAQPQRLNAFERALFWAAILLAGTVLLVRLGSALFLWYLRHSG